MPQTISAAGVIVFLVLPGALYIWGFERVVGAWGIRLTDRLLRFLGVSAVFHALLFPATAWFLRTYVITGRLQQGDFGLALWPLVLAYVLLPLLAGTAIGRATTAEQTWAA